MTDRPISLVLLEGDRLLKQQAREQVATDYDVVLRTGRFSDQLKLLGEVPYRDLDAKIKRGESLTYEEAFVGMCYVLCTTNSHIRAQLGPMIARAYGRSQIGDLEMSLIGTAFISSMATKEALKNLSSKEIAGFVAAASMDTVVELNFDEVVETCGMGGDRGYQRLQGKKTINVSTLSSIVLASTGIPAIKHGSYGNTTKIGSTEAIEMFGVNPNYLSLEEVYEYFAKIGFCYLDAHWSKTIHDLSHLLMMETINHIVGPMTPPISSNTRLTKLIGVNEKVHPSDVVRAYMELHRRGVYNVGGVVAVCGLSDCWRTFSHDRGFSRAYGILDELSPFGNIIATSFEKHEIGCTYFDLESLCVVNPDEIFIENSKETLEIANYGAISGENINLARYLAANAAFGYYAHVFMGKYPSTLRGLDINLLRESYVTCLEVITSGRSVDFLHSLVS